MNRWERKRETYYRFFHSKCMAKGQTGLKPAWPKFLLLENVGTLGNVELELTG